MKRLKLENENPCNKLCLACGLCCNGALFADVKLQPKDDRRLLRKQGLPLKTFRSGIRFTQPCAALDGCRCRIYDYRPKHCRDFECAQLRLLKSGRITFSATVRAVRETQSRKEQALRLLRELGDTDEHLPVRTRFQRTADRLHEIGTDEQQAELFSGLTLAVHDLNFLLQQSFYPGPTTI